MTELWRLGATELAGGYRRGEFDPVQVLEACLERVSACQGATNAMLLVDAAGAGAAARASAARWQSGQPLGPMDGIPVSLKDNLHAAGLPTTWGSKLLRNFVPAGDELPVARLRASGAVIFAKTNLPEFALQGVTENLLAGATRNPWDLSLTPGGSSGGAAAAVAGGCGPLALATDGGGSTRRPASHTGIVGFKPSSGFIARGKGLPEIFLDYEVPGILGRSVADVLAMSGVLASEFAQSTGAPKPARILYVPRFAANPVDNGIAGCVARAARRWAEMGHQVEESAAVDWAEAVNETWPALSNAGLAWMAAHAWRFPEFKLEEGQQLDVTQCGPAAQANIAQGMGAPATALFDALSAVHTLKQRMDALFTRQDFILTPATASLPWAIGASHPATINGAGVGPRGHAIFTAFANAAGLPAIALPAGFVGGLPAGFQLVGRAGQDAALLALALEFERAFPWRDAWPPEPH